MYRQDWFMRQIQMMVEFIVRLIFNKSEAKYELHEEENETDRLYERIDGLLEENDINGAENLLADSLRTDNRDYLLLAMDFYSRINQLSDEQLEAANFSREEIEDGLRTVTKLFGLSLPY